MPSIIIQLDPATMADPNLDIRYVLPALLAERTGGLVAEDGYDYVGEGSEPCMLVYLRTADVAAGVKAVVAVLTTERVMGNDLSAAPIAVEDEGRFEVVHPPGYAGDFPRADG